MYNTENGSENEDKNSQKVVDNTLS